MIIESVLTPVFVVINFLISLLPRFGALPEGFVNFLNLIGYGLNFVPKDVWIAFIVSVTLWKFGLIAWAIIEWIYKKLPGVS